MIIKMTYRDPPTSYKLTVRDIPPRFFSDFQEMCKKRNLTINEAIIKLVDLYAKTGGKCLEERPQE